jgi:hypothetical protein
VSEAIADLTVKLAADFAKEFPDAAYGDKGNILTMFQDTYEHTGRKFVILIDEWDAVFRERKEDADGQKEYLDFLRFWLKDQVFMSLVYMTGILPIKKYGKHSALNMFDEYSMTDQEALARFAGFTQEEIDALCEKYEMSKEETALWYNGYLLEDRHKRYSIYSPRSAVKSMMSGKFSGYWTKTETFEALRVYIVLDFDGLRYGVTQLLAGDRIRIDTATFTNDMSTFASADDVFTLLVHLGYLGYDSEAEEVFIPNKEIRAEYVSAMTNGGWPEVVKAVKASGELLKRTWARDSGHVERAIHDAHMETSHLTYNSETALRYTLSLAYYAARDYYTVVHELPSGDGFADLAFIPLPHKQDKPAMLIELKWDKAAVTALTQMREKRYSEALAPYAKENGGAGILLVGVSYDRDSREHECLICEV